MCSFNNATPFIINSWLESLCYIEKQGFPKETERKALRNAEWRLRFILELLKASS